MSSPQPPLVRFHQAGPIGHLQLAHPGKLNAMSEALGDAFAAKVEEAKRAQGLRVLLLSGEGKAFSAGGDLAFLQARAKGAAADNEATMRAFYARFLCLRELACPTVALVHGRATGAGLAMALACDVVLVAEDALLSLNFVRLGLSPGMGATYTLPRLVGPQKAAALLLTGEELTGQEAVAWGLALKAVPPERLLPEGQALAEAIAKNAPLAVRLTKEALRANAQASLPEALGREALAQAAAYASADYAEGLAALLGKRTPRFTGA